MWPLQNTVLFLGEGESFTVKASWNSAEANQLKNHHPGFKKSGIQTRLLTHGIWARKLIPPFSSPKKPPTMSPKSRTGSYFCSYLLETDLSSNKERAALLVHGDPVNLFLNLPTSPERLDLQWSADLRGRISAGSSTQKEVLIPCCLIFSCGLFRIWDILTSLQP